MNCYIQLLHEIDKPSILRDEEWENLDKKTVSTICLCLIDSILFNVAKEKTMEDLWEKLEKLYETKLEINNIFL